MKKRIISFMLAFVMGITVIGSSVGAAKANEKIPENENSIVNDEYTSIIEDTASDTALNNEFNDIYYDDFTDNEIEELKDLGLTEEQINLTDLSSLGISEEKENTQINDTTGNLIKEKITPKNKGKVTAIIKTFIKLYKKLPKFIRKKIESYISPNTIISVIENTTHALENSLYKAFRKRGMSKTVAKWASKIIIALVY